MQEAMTGTPTLDDDRALEVAAELGRDFLRTVGKRPVGATASVEQLREALAVPLADEGVGSEKVIRELASGADAGLIASAGPRFFGFVIGGNLPVSVAADWLTSAWDQNAGLYAVAPAAAVIEDVAGSWLRDLLGLPEDCSFGFTTGATMANFTALAAARHHVLERAGWDVEDRGLQGAPTVRVLVGDEAHAVVFSSLRLLGLGRGTAVRVAADDQGRMRPDALAEALAAGEGPCIVIAQAGDVNSGASDPFREIIPMAHDAGAWVHVDGAFGLWAATSPKLRGQVAGVEGADSWATDAHKWLNVPYDCGVVFVRDRITHCSAVGLGAPTSEARGDAPYLIDATGLERDGHEWVPEASRRARAVPVYAALRHLGRNGVANLIERSTELAQRMADRLGADPAVEVLNEVALNQVVVRFAGQDANPMLPMQVAGQVQSNGVTWVGPTMWRGGMALRLSVSGWATTTDDIDRAADDVLAAVRAVSG